MTRLGRLATTFSWRETAIFGALLVAVLAVSASGVFADNTDPRGENQFLYQGLSGSRYAWGENIGWLKARPAGEAYGPGGVGLQVTDTSVSGYLWGENIGWVNLNCANDSTCAGVAGNWGVTNDSLGDLAGYAWGENIGWINFSCQTNSTCNSVNYGVTIDPSTGQFHGEAWSENTGWIKFNCSDDATCGTAQYAVQTGWPDSDGDSCRDSKEAPQSLDPYDEWDYYNVPVPALFAAPDPTTVVRDGAVVGSDAQAVFSYVKKAAKVGKVEYDQDLNLNGIPDGIEYDRTVAAPGKSGPPDGVIPGADAQLAFAEAKLALHC